jgi:hypothetical protein
MSVQDTKHETLSEVLLICGIIPPGRECYVVYDMKIKYHFVLQQDFKHFLYVPYNKTN